MLEYTAVSDLTLLVRHLPPILTEDEKISLLKTFGAVRVRVMRSHGHMKNCAFATFSDQSSTQRALSMLHQLDVLGHRLVVVYARSEDARFIPRMMTGPEPSTSASSVRAHRSETNTCCCEELKSVMAELDSILPIFRPTAQLPLRLPYEYPPASKRVIDRIARLLMSSPPFYVRVLDLMNKMNLPCPLTDLDESLPSPASEKTNDGKITKADGDKEVASSSLESELSSEEEPQPKPMRLHRRAATTEEQQAALRHKKLKRILKYKELEWGATSKKPAKESVPTKCTFKRSIDIVLNAPVTEAAATTAHSSTAVSSDVGQFGRFSPKKQTEPGALYADGSFDFSTIFSMDWIHKRRLDKSRFADYPVFKNYSHGVPSCRLYIKNVAKKVTVLDLQRIFGNFVDVGDPVDVQAFHVCLMTRGKLRGQAFVSFASVDKASSALRSTNGLMLYDKPLVVAFARSQPQ